MNKNFRNLHLPFSYGTIWLLMLLFFGVEFFLLFLFPLLAMISFWAVLSAYVLWASSKGDLFEKPKRKRKLEEYDWNQELD